MERDGRVRLHLHPTVKRALGEAARRAGLTLAAYLTYAGLAAAADPEILKQGLAEAKTL
jgi:D-serine deaminase-like pyridoxal phosphate-dependent protein